MKKTARSVTAKKKVLQSAKPKAIRVKRQTADTKEEKALASQIAKVSVNARRRAYSNNASVTVIRNGKIIRIHAKKKQVIGSVKKTPVTVDVTKPVRIK